MFDDWIRQTDRSLSLIMRASAVKYDEDEGLYELTLEPRRIGDRFDQLAIFEMALQHYVRENPRDLGFTGARGPFAQGPDLHVKVKRRWVHAEVEVHAANYVKHGHPADPNFARVEILIVPEQRIAPSLRARLPNAIVAIKREPFVAWFESRQSERRFDRTPKRRAEAQLAAYADLANRLENASIAVATCQPCGIRATFRVEEQQPGFRDPDDRVELRCPACKSLIGTVKALDATLVKRQSFRRR